MCKHNQKKVAITTEFQFRHRKWWCIQIQNQWLIIQVATLQAFFPFFRSPFGFLLSFCSFIVKKTPTNNLCKMWHVVILRAFEKQVVWPWVLLLLVQYLQTNTRTQTKRKREEETASLAGSAATSRLVLCLLSFEIKMALLFYREMTGISLKQVHDFFGSF